MDSKEYSASSSERYSNESPPSPLSDGPARLVEEKGIRFGEAADMYGDQGSAEEYGYVSRGLKSLGWNSWYQFFVTMCAEIAAAPVIIQFWNGAPDNNVAAWISIIIILVICLNVFTVAIYGEAEFCFASIKIITIVGLIIFAFVIDLGGGPTHNGLGFCYWNNPGAMKAYKGTGSAGRFLGLFLTLVNAAFSSGGVEIMAVAAGEAKNPRYNIPKAVRRVFWRILFFYVLGSLPIGVLISYNEPRLLGAIENDEPGGAASPWVIAIYRAGVPVLPSIINAVILPSATSSAFLFTGSRYIYARAQNGQAPRFLRTCSKRYPTDSSHPRGVPYYCVGATASVSLLTYLSCSASSQTVFTWCSVSIAYLRYHAALRAHEVDRRRDLVFRSPAQPYTAWFALVFSVIVIVFNGFHVFGEMFDAIHGR
ncbi:MAG: hypothetical protein Q9210_004009, partial [Variospora velana]